ncbi:MAG TPA: FAD-dependent monooxygenase, partial [Stellaceae bacterium]|nr:FAD-dependent monooxygenase [Stellaceae bacterium]
MTVIRNVLIVGGGLAGQTLANALARRGIRAEVIEIHARWNVLGVGISVQGPTLRALKSVGLLDRCLAEGFGYSELTNCDQNGKVLSVVDLPRMLGPDYPSCVGIMRPVLHDVLFEAMHAAGVPVRMGVDGRLAAARRRRRRRYLQRRLDGAIRSRGRRGRCLLEIADRALRHGAASAIRRSGGVARDGAAAGQCQRSTLCITARATNRVL